MTKSVAYRLLMCGATLACLAAIWAPDYTPLVDFPSHLARAYVLDVYDQVEVFEQWYRLSPGLHPNLAIDLLVPPLLSLFDPPTAAKIFLSLYVLLFAFGVHLLFSAAEGGPNLIAPAAVFLCFHSSYQHGFINYAFSIPLFLIALAAWLRYTERRTPGGWMLAALLGLACFVAHLAGFFAFAVSVGVMSFYRLLRRSLTPAELVRDVAVVAPAVAVYLLPGDETTLTQTQIEFSGLASKIIGFGGIFISNVWQLDLLRLACIGGALAALAWTRSLAFRPMYLTTGLTFAVLYLAFPYRMFANVGTGADIGTGVDVRLILPMYLLLLCSLRPTPPPRAGRLALGSVMLASLVWVAGLAVTWRMMSDRMAGVVELLDRVEPGTRLVSVTSTAAPRLESRLRRALTHVASHAIIRRHAAHAAFFAEPGAQPVVYRDFDIWPLMTHWESGTPERFAEVIRVYDYVLGCYLPGAADEIVAEAGGSLAAENEDCKLWELRRPPR